MYSHKIDEVNKFDETQFVNIFGNVVELCPDSAKQVWKGIPFDDVEGLCEAFGSYLEGLPDEGKITVLRLHPDLAGRLAAQGGLTRESTLEQTSAGLNELTTEQKQTMDLNNEKYKSKFGFPFIICARENKIQSILDGLKTRYNNTRSQEITTAINEVKKICKLRIMDIVHN